MHILEKKNPIKLNCIKVCVWKKNQLVKRKNKKKLLKICTVIKKIILSIKKLIKNGWRNPPPHLITRPALVGITGLGGWPSFDGTLKSDLIGTKPDLTWVLFCIDLLVSWLEEPKIRFNHELFSFCVNSIVVGVLVGVTSSRLQDTKVLFVWLFVSWIDLLNFGFFNSGKLL